MKEAQIPKGGRRASDRMVVGFTTTYAISAYHHWCFEFEARSGRGVQQYVIKSETNSIIQIYFVYT